MAVWDGSTAEHSQSNVSIGLDVAQTLFETSVRPGLVLVGLGTADNILMALTISKNPACRGATAAEAQPEQPRAPPSSMQYHASSVTPVRASRSGVQVVTGVPTAGLPQWMS